MNIDEIIACRIATLRNAQQLSLAQLAERSGVSKAMISKIERQDSSPTANVLGRLASGLGVPLAQLLSSEEAEDVSALRRRDDQPTWRDPATNYIRRQIAGLDKASRSELIEIDLPASTQVNYPFWHTKPYRQRLWVLEGRLEILYGEDLYTMLTGDLLEFAVDKPISYIANKHHKCRYLLNILHD
ncbi:XRE family transcriptional regulator [Pseudomonas luteola]|uniref:XRE family transcriptional regulator n=1 Tax=Pseudomonas luteola TaxID=47886 RepID=UPI000F7AF3E7|nr:XRE family transcriptional regulator [Pseudomonas luteola]MCG7374095.1 XRE family transcriptional regulator [Pseudomonas luteola]RRW39475.1 XRE family transcriptional regulator [Pseudomonas luteola]